ncbi:YfhO family protein [Paenibacillus sp. D2_2]|uniref:YfhO family protein n=1 Tax=Paenibacillus sp. D2_2 TaxID=3073092 RepID=UPI002815931C|nr:YfhO family protein [Paenibacillus sp. D2_2]WMT40591.1 YfhO family protein [Paenibacillus sp. D2_2]
MRIDISNAPGQFTISDLKIQIIDNKSLGNIEKLKGNVLNISEHSNDYIRGNIVVDKPEKLFISIPFDKGWKAKINGEEVEVSKINIGFIGLDLPVGNNEVELNYVPPLLITGSIISFISLLGIIMFKITLKRRKSSNQ